MTMVEKVARAICTARGIDPEKVVERVIHMGEERKRRLAWEREVAAACAAIEAMAEPTEEMRAVLALALDGWNIRTTDIMLDDIWRDMIRAAGETGEKG